MFDELDVTKQIIYNSILYSHSMLDSVDKEDEFVNCCIDYINQNKLSKSVLKKLIKSLNCYSPKNQSKLQKAIFINQLSSQSAISG